ncbi:MAG: Pr6Pr family membrane protein [Clostridia bacterium]|nr:Pr6Pr family membrane protein [Clostridia bacterium]
MRMRIFSTGFKGLLALCAWAGIVLQCGPFTSAPNFSTLRYYTLISNLLIAGYFSFAAIWAGKGRPAPLPTFKGALIMGITVTGLVFHIMLSGLDFGMGDDSGLGIGGTAQAVANQLLHTVTPIMAVLDWLIFDKKGGYGKLAPLQWVIIPDVYFVLATIYGFTIGTPFYGGSRFPYFFIDYDIQGVGGVLLYALALNLAFIALGYVFVLIDRLLAKIRKRSEKVPYFSLREERYQKNP